MIENVCDITVNVDEKLSIDKFNVDEENAHIVLTRNSASSCCAVLQLFTRSRTMAASASIMRVASNVAPVA